MDKVFFQAQVLAKYWGWVAKDQYLELGSAQKTMDAGVDANYMVLSCVAPKREFFIQVETFLTCAGVS